MNSNTVDVFSKYVLFKWKYSLRHSVLKSRKSHILHNTMNLAFRILTASERALHRFSGKVPNKNNVCITRTAIDTGGQKSYFLMVLKHCGLLQVVYFDKRRPFALNPQAQGHVEHPDMHSYLKLHSPVSTML